ncbi:HD domain-containing protein [Streptomyces sp. Y1]|uniref:HD domain-containing protein n=1 Tax=Streptomyces sp. Y1 TaxID=3238634 RepID=A0AB39TVH1_9ACTN
MMRQPPEIPDESAWAKARGLDPAYPRYPLVRHLLDASAMALWLWDHYLSDNQRRCIADGLGLADDPAQARAITGLCAGLHDIGKLSGFQFCDAQGREHLSQELVMDADQIGKERLAHDEAGMLCTAAVLHALGFDDQQDHGVAERIAEIIGGHHGRFFRYRAANAPGPSQVGLGGEAYARQRVAHALAVHAAVGAPGQPKKFTASAAVLVTGVVILADWLVSQEDYLRRRQSTLEASLERHFANSCADAEGLAREAGLVPVKLARAEFSLAYGIEGQPNPLQRSVIEDLPAAVAAGAGRGKAGILLVTAAPGDGKSEVALEAERVLSGAFGTRGLAFLLPTMATSDQMHRRVAGALDRQSASCGGGLTLTHSMAWLSRAYADGDLCEGETVLVGDDAGAGGGLASREQLAMRPRQWLRGAKRPLLAQFTVGTIDQALMSVLPVRHNALRLLALSGKTFIVDEAHAYDPYMQVLLGRLLNWLGAYGAPVVLLSATLPASVSDRLIKEYLRGAGHRPSALKAASFASPYPGWLYVDAATAEQTSISRERRDQQALERPMDLCVQVERVAHGAGGNGGGRARLAVIAKHLDQLVADGGCALVVCNTVADAQQTYTRLKERYGGRGLDDKDILLLHARFPGDVREARTSEVTAGMGRTGPRPDRRIIVATQVVEQSLDLDADVVISDLAPMALLLQRAGRCWRHEAHWSARGRPGGKPRPGWAVETGPRLVVLDPVVDGGGVPEQWGEVYAEFLLVKTSQALSLPGRGSIAVPGDVPGLVEEVHGDRDGFIDWGDPRQSAARSAFVGKRLAHQTAGEVIAIPRARQVAELRELHHLDGTEDEWEAATRLGADAVRLLCVYQHDGGNITLDPEGQQELPKPDDRGRMAVADVRAVMSRTIPVSETWFKGCADNHRPEAWADHPMLSELLMLRQPTRNSVAQAVAVGDHSLRLDEDLGLVRQRSISQSKEENRGSS